MVRQPKFHVAYKPPVQITHVQWDRLSDGSWQSGNIQLRLVSTEYVGDHPCEQWGIWVKHDGRWNQCYCNSRKWLYGSPGQAKRGITKVTEFVFGNPMKGR